jgi:hypothetical protein
MESSFPEQDQTIAKYRAERLQLIAEIELFKAKQQRQSNATDDVRRSPKLVELEQQIADYRQRIRQQ